jgi:hypothetical protein
MSSLGRGKMSQTGTLTCTYSSYASDKGVYELDEDLVLRFVIDKATDKAYLVGDNGTSEVQMIQSRAGISFLEVTGSGNLMTTAVDLSGTSVHSRNALLDGGLVASQSYGWCHFK